MQDMLATYDRVVVEAVVSSNSTRWRYLASQYHQQRIESDSWLFFFVVIVTTAIQPKFLYLPTLEIVYHDYFSLSLTVL